jgi:hypothetical protein
MLAAARGPQSDLGTQRARARLPLDDDSDAAAIQPEA